MKSRFLAPTVLALAMCAPYWAACDTDFDPPSLIDGPRILSIGAEPPEVSFGSDVRFEALVVDENAEELPGRDGVSLRWTVCVSLAEVIGAAGLGFGVDVEDNCDEGGDDLVRLTTDESAPREAVLPGAALAGLLTMFGEGGGGGGGGGGNVDPELLATLAVVVQEVGVPLRVRLEVLRDGEVILTGFKRFAITQRENPTTNPPPPRFAVDGVWLSARGGGDPHVCVPEEGVTPTVTGPEIDFTPDPDEASWIETYPVVSLAGDIQQNVESAYYSWFSTGGSFGESITQAPTRDVVWETPEEPGTYPLWLAVRDGHLGSSWCRAEAIVAP